MKSCADNVQHSANWLWRFVCPSPRVDYLSVRNAFPTLLTLADLQACPTSPEISERASTSPQAPTGHICKIRRAEPVARFFLYQPNLHIVSSNVLIVLTSKARSQRALLKSKRARSAPHGASKIAVQGLFSFLRSFEPASRGSYAQALL